MIKIEFDLPNFEKELNINITIRKDGEVVYTTATSSSSCGDKNLAATTAVRSEVESSPTAPIKSGGNMMNMDF